MSTHVSSVGALDFESEVLKANKLVVVDFWAEWCGPCKMIAPLLEEVARELSDKIKIVKINVDQEQQLAQEYGIYNIPTLLFFKGGVVREQVVGTAAKKILIEKINAHA
ncbi:MAG TPA: thioredoxin [Candidatus Methylacidiphilales bacterium]|jgi:thioredoxin 1|nr:thioredoxin [Candidatus Methylacidiphilales bacterium]